jgi:acetyl-CoA carboxylase biotin carboxylase subunit
MPSCGVITYLYEPSGPGIRNDSGIYEGWEVTPYYDPILSKLVAFAEDRETARRRMLRALDEYVVHGVQTGIALHKRILRHPAFIAGEVTTTFIDEHADELLAALGASATDEVFIAAALVLELGVGRSALAPGGSEPGAVSPWQRIGRWEIGGAR